MLPFKVLPSLLFALTPACSLHPIPLSSTSSPSPPAPSVEVDTRGPIRIITLNRPHRHNAVDLATAALLHQAFLEFNSEPSVHVAVLHGKGGSFCAGYDLKELALDGETLPAAVVSSSKDMGKKPSPMGPTHMVFSKPVLASVSGYAVAGGLELALMCDLRIMEEDAIMGVFSRRFGVPLIDGGTIRLPRLIGLSRAMDLILTGRPVGAQEAKDIGLANRVVPKGHALDEAISLAEQLCKFPQKCLRADRLSTLTGAFGEGTMQDALLMEHTKGTQVLEESVQGAQRFARGKGRGGDFKDI